ncbi:MAG: hypothetical protein SWJ54_20365, partial [Cyanobacteriota bacterium]|nr:hypothetical protein [Cyanobacteriota bacterium]
SIIVIARLELFQFIVFVLFSKQSGVDTPSGFFSSKHHSSKLSNDGLDPSLVVSLSRFPISRAIPVMGNQLT